MRNPIDDDGFSRLHGATGHEDGRNIEPHGRIEHSRRDLVTVGNADNRVRGVRIDHIFDGIGDDFAGRE